jgi:hypothetical protein
MTDGGGPKRRSRFGKFFDSPPALVIGLVANLAGVVALFSGPPVAIVLTLSALAILIGFTVTMSSRNSLRPWGVIVGSAVAVVGAGIGGYSIPREGAPVSCGESQGVIERPRHGEHVPLEEARYLVAEGDMPPNALCSTEGLVAFVRLNNASAPTYFQQEGPCVIKDRKFSCGTIGAVSRVGASVDILVYRVDSEHLRQLVDKEIAAQKNSGPRPASANPPLNAELFASETIVIAP